MLFAINSNHTEIVTREQMLRTDGQGYVNNLAMWSKRVRFQFMFQNGLKNV